MMVESRILPGSFCNREYSRRSSLIKEYVFVQADGFIEVLRRRILRVLECLFNLRSQALVRVVGAPGSGPLRSNRVELDRLSMSGSDFLALFQNCSRSVRVIVAHYFYLLHTLGSQTLLQGNLRLEAVRFFLKGLL